MRDEPHYHAHPGPSPMRASESSGWSEHWELDRIRRMYARRSARGAEQRYDPYDPARILALHERERLLLSELRDSLATPLHELEILDVGCGSGGELARLVGHGADPARAHGVDLRRDVIRTAQERLPTADLQVANAAELPYPPESMDLVLQLTMFSSVLDRGLRARIAAEMRRVVKRNGIIVSYDFLANPLNREVRGLSRRELRRLFPGHRIRARSVTLAPPIARLVASRSYGLGQLLQAAAPLRTHVLAFISPRPSEGDSRVSRPP